MTFPVSLAWFGCEHSVFGKLDLPVGRGEKLTRKEDINEGKSSNCRTDLVHGSTAG